MEDLNNEIAASYEKENRGGPRLFARHIITLTEPITSESVIHDNACGPVVVTSEILFRIPSSDTPPKIFATDITEGMIGASNDIIKNRKWDAVTASIMPAQKLSFDNDTFTHSFTNFLVPSHPDAPSEIYRTLKPGGTAAYTTWKLQGFVHLMRRCIKFIFPDADAEAQGPPAVTEDMLRAQFQKAGFGENDIRVLSHREELPFQNVDDLLRLTEGPFGKFFTKDWKAEDVDKLPDAIRQVLTAEEKERGSLDLIAWVVVAKKT